MDVGPEQVARISLVTSVDSTSARNIEARLVSPCRTRVGLPHAGELGMHLYVNASEAGSSRAIATPSARLNPIDSESAYREQAGYNA